MRREDYSKAELVDYLSGCWTRRNDRYSELRGTGAEDRPKVEMSYIGG